MAPQEKRLAHDLVIPDKIRDSSYDPVEVNKISNRATNLQGLQAKCPLHFLNWNIPVGKPTTLAQTSYEYSLYSPDSHEVQVVLLMWFPDYGRILQDLPRYE